MARCRREAPEVTRVAGEDSIAAARQEDNSCVNRIGGACPGHQFAGIAAILLVDNANVDCPEQSCEADLASAGITPHLGHHHCIAAKLKAALPGDAQPGHHGTVSAIDRDQRSGIQN
ncbi:MAG TPA: hypothetical protein VGG35_15710 [Streptosporangiaceae bacterium]